MVKPISIEVAGTDLTFRGISLNDSTPSGGQIAQAAGFSPDDHVYVLQWLDDGDLEDVRENESVSLEDGRRFIVAESDRSYRLTMDGEIVDWPARFITAATLRKLTNVKADRVIYFEKTDEADELLAENEVVDLELPGVEKFRQGKDRPKEQKVDIKHLGELETASFKIAETASLQEVWDRAYAELEIARDPRDVFQADLMGEPIDLMDHLQLSLKAAQEQNLCKRKFEIAARTGGA